jgi:hypothetical protein
MVSSCRALARGRGSNDWSTTMRNTSEDDVLVFETEDRENEQALTRFVLDAASGDVALEDLAGAQTNSVIETVSVPLLFTIEQDRRKVTYRRGDVVPHFATGVIPTDGVWVEVDLRTSLKKAHKLYGTDLLAYEKVYRVTSMEITGMMVRRRIEQTIRLLVRRASSMSQN